MLELDDSSFKLSSMSIWERTSSCASSSLAVVSTKFSGAGEGEHLGVGLRGEGVAFKGGGVPSGVLGSPYSLSSSVGV